jgi:hypothetical protein
MYFLNSILLWEKRSDGDFPIEVLREMRLEVRRRFPRFRSNKFHRQHFSFRARILIGVAMASPEAYSVASKVFTQADRALGFLLRGLGKNQAVYQRTRAIYRRLLGRA